MSILRQMSFRFIPYMLELNRPFSIAGSTRSTTPAVIVQIERDGTKGYGEASMPPYLGESLTTAEAFLSRVNLEQYESLFPLEEIVRDIDALAPENNAAKAAVDIALHDWAGKTMGYSWHSKWELNAQTIPPTSYTIGMDSKQGLRERLRGAGEFKILKVKLGGTRDKEMIDTIREMTDQIIRVDANQGWRNKSDALEIIHWLAQRGVELVEQPLPKEQVDDIAWLRERSPLPIIADEAVRRLSDLRSALGVYDGINVKLMKCTGMMEAHRMITTARQLGMKVMLGCMTETSCGISAAAQLAPLADWVDLDGALLIKNDPFRGVEIVGGRLVTPDKPGIGVEPVVDMFGSSGN